MELNRRLDHLTGRVDHMDEKGTRGVDGLRVEVRELATDLARHEVKHEKASEDQRSFRRWIVGIIVAALLTVIANPFLVIWLAR